MPVHEGKPLHRTPSCINSTCSSASVAQYIPNFNVDYATDVTGRAWRIMLIFLILCYASNAHLLNIYASRIYYYAQYYAHSGNNKKATISDMWYTNGPLLIWAPTVTLSLAVTLSAIVKRSGQRSILDVLKRASKLPV